RTLQDRNECRLIALRENQLELTLAVLIVVKQEAVPDFLRREAVPRLALVLWKMLQPRSQRSQHQRDSCHPLLAVNNKVRLGRSVSRLIFGHVDDGPCEVRAEAGRRSGADD